ncbi:DNA-binding transcriptional regulator PhoP [Xenorhabdus vietnamensis]|uniref:DNA-binding transcriptional regulator PhoP n=1 Tax=Xenorhabdus vietnamensis TaxID=351656 RepID=A0A1Y2SBP8_9GAMM|nr:two-component system response regulator PhoP [Xenorhabdus vietnamensis]OTA16132.1 DNA-binding transcriptional regulator PhoP [Xenorhabdus vietnamensis]
MRILIVEDNYTLRHHYATQLGNMGYAVHCAENTKEADYYLKEFHPDVAIVDLGLPEEDGLSMIRRWRSKNINLPILVVTVRETWQEKVIVLNAGADDYVTKPCQPEEISARIQALMRRKNGLASQLIEILPFSIDLSRKEFFINDIYIKLTAFEFIIMATLIRNNGKVVSKETLMRELYIKDKDEPRESHTIDVLIGRLRKKILNQCPGEVIITVRGQGYIFDVKPHNAQVL